MLEVPRLITVSIDTREKTPLPLPEWISWRRGKGYRHTAIQVRWRRTKLDAGDYTLEGYEDQTAIERKKGGSELFHNMTKPDHPRAVRAFCRLANTVTCPLVMVESTPLDVLRYGYKYDYPQLLSDFNNLMWKIRLPIIWGGRHTNRAARRQLGEFCLGLMLARIFVKSPPRTEPSGAPGVLPTGTSKEHSTTDMDRKKETQ